MSAIYLFSYIKVSHKLYVYVQAAKTLAVKYPFLKHLEGNGYLFDELEHIHPATGNGCRRFNEGFNCIVPKVLHLALGKSPLSQLYLEAKEEALTEGLPDTDFRAALIFLPYIFKENIDRFVTLGAWDPDTPYPTTQLTDQDWKIGFTWRAPNIAKVDSNETHRAILLFKPNYRAEHMETNIRETLQADFDTFDISEELGFLLEEPLTNLPDYYRVWMDLANNVTHLIESHKLRDLVHKMPVLNPHLLSNHRELRLAHLALGFISMGYVWQEGQQAPAQILPKALAWPYWLVSRRLGLPPILTYADSVLANWKLRDPAGDMESGNMDLIFSFPGGESCRGFFIVSLLVEMAACSGITGALEVMHAMKTSDLIGIQKGLVKVTQSLKKMRETFKLMHNHVDPTAFHGTLRIFVSGWRDNPMLPRGLLYEGVSNEPILLSGGSAAQSSAIQCFDALLCIQHENETGAFLTRMRDYMPPAHRQLIETLSVCPSLRDFILSHYSSDLCQAYNSCVSALVDLRNYHLSIVTKYVVVPGNHTRTMGCPLRGVGTALNTTGTGGSSLMVFLKSVRNTTQKALILE